LFDVSDFEISAPQCPTYYSPLGNEDILDIVVHKNIRLSNIIVSDILDSGHLPVIFHIPTSWKEAKVVALPKPGKDPKFPQNPRPTSLLPSTGKVFEKVVLEFVKRYRRKKLA
jgi:hypothetical protein